MWSSWDSFWNHTHVQIPSIKIRKPAVNWITQKQQQSSDCPELQIRLTSLPQPIRTRACLCLQVNIIYFQFSSVQLLSRVRLFETPGTAAHQASLSITNFRSPLKLMSIESVMPSNYLILIVPSSSCSQSLPASGSFPSSQFFTSGGQSIGASASTSVLPMNTQDWSPLRWTGWISLQSRDKRYSTCNNNHIKKGEKVIEL